MGECTVNKAFLRKRGVEVHFVSQLLPEGHVGKLIEKIFEWTDELQSIQIWEYAFQGQKQVTQKGFHGGGKVPYGYKRVRDARLPRARPIRTARWWNTSPTR